MNLFFGKRTPGHAVDGGRTRVADYCGEHHGAKPVFEKGDASLLLGHLRAGGKILGRANQDGCVLLFNGSFFDPFPGLAAGRALDGPDGVARVLVRRYLERGTTFLDGLAGYYSLLVADSRSNQIHLAADPYGQRAPVYHQHDGALVFASNVAAAATLIDSLRIDRSWEDFFLIYGFYPHGHTPFAGLMAVPAGHLLTWTGETLIQRRISPYEPGETTGLVIGASLAEATDVLHDAFMRSLEQQCGRNRDVGVLLGGFDSALVAAGLRRLGKNVSTWSFSYDEQKYNQPHVEDLAAFLGIEHHWVPITRSDLESGLDNFPYIFNQPTNWPNYVIQTALVCRHMRKAGVATAYSGDGCDTVFLGYPGTWRRAQVLGRVPSLPDWLARCAASMIARPYLERRIGHPYRVMLNLIRSSSWPRHVRGFLSFRLLDEISLKQLRGAQVPESPQNIRRTAEELASPYRHLTSLRLAYQGKSLVSPNKNKMNGSSDATGIPILSPYMHPAFRQLAQSIPEELCRPHEATASRITGKYVLMKMAEEKCLLPKEVIYQKKMAAVDAPIDRWYAGPMRDFMRRKMADLPFVPDMNYVDSLLAPHLAEQLFQKYLLTDRIIKQAPSLLATYAAFCRLADQASRNGSTKT